MLLSWFIEWLFANYDLIISFENGCLIVAFRRRHQATTITFLNEKGEQITMLEMTETQQAPLTLNITDAKGRPAKVDGVPSWSSSNIDVATVTDISTDGLSATVKGVAPGLCQVTVTADADLGAGVKNITGFLDVNITGGEAITVELVPGTPVEQTT